MLVSFSGCAAGSDELGMLECSPSEVPRWNGNEWVCSSSDVLSQLSCAMGAIPKWDGSNWVCGADDSASFTASYPLNLEGNNLSIATAGITSNHIANSTIVDEDISPGAAIDPGKIAGTAATLTGNQAFGNNTLVINAGNTQVGIGVNPPTTTLDVGGDVSTTGDYRFSTARLRTLHRTASAFRMAYPGSTSYDPVSIATTGNYAYITDGTATYYAYLMADVPLPDGAVIDSMTCYFYDNTSTVDISSNAYLYVRPLTSLTGSSLVTVPMTTSGEASSAMRTVSGSPVSTTVVDNTTNTYFLRVYWYTGANASSSARFYGCSIHYWVDRL